MYTWTRFYPRCILSFESFLFISMTQRECETIDNDVTFKQSMQWHFFLVWALNGHFLKSTLHVWCLPVKCKPKHPSWDVWCARFEPHWLRKICWQPPYYSRHDSILDGKFQGHQTTSKNIDILTFAVKEGAFAFICPYWMEMHPFHCFTHELLEAWCKDKHLNQ